MNEAGDVTWQGHLEPPLDLSDTNYRDFIPRVTIAPDGSILIGRKYVSSLAISDDFGNEVLLNGTTARNGPTAYPYPSYFVARFSEDGELLWARTSPNNTRVDRA